MSFLIDVIILLIITLYTFDGYRQGFIRLFLDVVGIVVSFIVALKFYPQASNIFNSWGLNANLAKPLGFFAIWTVTQVFFYLLAYLIFHYTPAGLQYNRINKILGLIPGFIKGVLIIAIFLIILMILPLTSATKNIITNSYLAGKMVSATAQVENR